MTQQQTYGPPARAALPEPLVLPVDPVLGWQLADPGRRTAAVLALPLAAVMSLASTSGAAPLPGGWIVLWALVGPAAFYSLARVLRPGPRSPERTPRHLLAGTATSFAVPVLAAMASPHGDDGVIVGLGSPAAALGLVTLLWGAVALLVRIGRRT